MHPEARPANEHWTRQSQDLPLVECRSISKRYGGVQALKGADFDLHRGEVHALLGQNGAGKSTLIKILSGVTRRDAGVIRIAGVEVDFKDATSSQAAGVAVVYQDLSLAPNLSIASNFGLGSEPKTRFGLIDRRTLRQNARDTMDQFGIDLDPDTIVGTLAFAQRQLLEIAKALSREPGILILDEPTSALSESEEKVLLAAIEAVLKRGVGVIHVTHRLKEVFQIAHRVTVFRDGVNVLTCRTADTDMPSLVAAIAGKATAKRSVVQSVAATAPIKLALDDVVARRVHGVSLKVRNGEVIGLAGMIGSGRTEILETVFGMNRMLSGRMSLDGKPYAPLSSACAIRSGVALVPEDRHRQGLVLDHSIDRNLATPRLDSLQRFGLFQARASAGRSRDTMRRLAIKAPDPDTSVRALSGGNQQKVVFGKWMAPDPRILLLDEPTVGVDVAARAEIYAAIAHMAVAGACVIIASSEMEELLLTCSRIGIVHSGNIVRWVDRAEIGGEEELHRLIQVHS